MPTVSALVARQLVAHDRKNNRVKITPFGRQVLAQLADETGAGGAS